MKKQDILKRLTELMDKYFDLVWYARQDKTDKRHPGRKHFKRLRKEQPNEIAALHGRSSDWHHGFNSGCLATLRLVHGLFGNAEEARQCEDEFPFLDT